MCSVPVLSGVVSLPSQCVVYLYFQVLSAASHLQMGEAVELCCNFMELALTVENCVDILNMCELYSLKQTLAISRGFILENFESLSETGMTVMKWLLTKPSKKFF